MIETKFLREDCKHIAYLYENDRSHWDKPACLRGNGSWPDNWSCPCECCDFEKNFLITRKEEPFPGDILGNRKKHKKVISFELYF